APEGIFAVPPDILVPVTEWIMLPARLFIALITMIVMPLVFCSILLAIAESDGFSFLRTTGLRAVFYFVFTTSVAVWIGITLTQTINPAQHVPDSWLAGQPAGIETLADAAHQVTAQKSVPQLIAEMNPANPFDALLE